MCYPRNRVLEDVLNCGRVLDKYCILTRYPNGSEKAAPFEYFTEEDARRVWISRDFFTLLQKTEPCREGDVDIAIPAKRV